MKDQITEYVFNFQCSVDWENLELTEDEKVRFCRQCSKNVHFVDSQTDLNENAFKGNCVAFKDPDPSIPEEIKNVLPGYILPFPESACESCKTNLKIPGESICRDCKIKKPKSKSWWQFWK